MPIHLDADLESTIHEKVASGRYPDTNAVIAEAIRLLEDAERRELFLSKLDSGLAQIEEGRTVPFTPELLESMKAEARRRKALGIRSSPDVRP